LIVFANAKVFYNVLSLYTLYFPILGFSHYFFVLHFSFYILKSLVLSIFLKTHLSPFVKGGNRRRTFSRGKKKGVIFQRGISTTSLFYNFLLFPSLIKGEFSKKQLKGISLYTLLFILPSHQQV